MPKPRQPKTLGKDNTYLVMKQTTQNNSLSAEEVEERMDEHVDAVLSSRRTAEQPAMELSKLRREQQKFVLHWVTAAAQRRAPNY